jgi:hypothetical protein
MTEELSKRIKSFCKSNKVSDKTLSDLYKLFANQKANKAYPYAAFEKGMEELNAAPVRTLKEKIAEYVKTEGPDRLQKFCMEQQFVTEGFWDRVVGGLSSKNASPTPVVIKKAQDSDSYDKLLPQDWMRMPLSDRIDFVEKVQYQHPGFYNYLIAKDRRIKEYLKKVKSYKKAPIKMYVLVFSFPSDNYSKEAKSLLKCFVETLNQIGRTSLQYVECTNPNVVEIREVR